MQYGFVLFFFTESEPSQVGAAERTAQHERIYAPAAVRCTRSMRSLAAASPVTTTAAAATTRRQEMRRSREREKKGCNNSTRLHSRENCCPFLRLPIVRLCPLSVANAAATARMMMMAPAERRPPPTRQRRKAPTTICAKVDFNGAEGGRRRRCTFEFNFPRCKRLLQRCQCCCAAS